MNKKTVSTTKDNTIIRSLINGFSVMILIGIVGVIIGTTFISKKILDENALKLITPIIWFSCALLGSIVAAKSFRKNVVLSAAIIATAFLVLLICLKLLVYKGPFHGIGKGILSIVLGVTIGTVLFCKPKTTKKTKFKYSPK